MRAWWDGEIKAGARPQCYRCGHPITPMAAWQLDHMDDGLRPYCDPDADRWPSHKRCNLKAGGEKGNARRGNGSFGADKGRTPAALNFLSLPEGSDERLAWNPDCLRLYPWLEDLAEVPETASPPLLMTPVPDDAVCSYGWDGCTHITSGTPAAPWVEKSQRMTLRWWQRLSLIRQLEHRADGTLCFRKKIESAPRRAGKSIGMKGQALWRLEHASLFGEVQTIIHTGSDMAICREIQRQAWRWAEGHSWTVTRGNGKEAIETATEDRWLVRAQDAVYGYDVCLGMVDEGWNVKPDTVTEGLEPATLERSSPQLVLTSTAHRRATSLMRSELTSAMTLADPETLLLLWGAVVGCDPSDPAVWRAASPYWSADREKLIRAKYEKALAGENDPEFDDPDPMKGFEAQYLNIWRIREPKQVGRAVVDSDAWSNMVGTAPDAPPDAVAVESWFDLGVAVAKAWDTDDGIVVTVVDCPGIPEAAKFVASLGVARPPLVGTSLADHSAWDAENVGVEPVSATVRVAVEEFAVAIKERRFKHARSGLLTEQALAVRVADTTAGVRVASSGRADAIKAATWAIRAASESHYDARASVL